MSMSIEAHFLKAAEFMLHKNEDIRTRKDTFMTNEAILDYIEKSSRDDHLKKANVNAIREVERMAEFYTFRAHQARVQRQKEWFPTTVVKPTPEPEPKELTLAEDREEVTCPITEPKKVEEIINLYQQEGTQIQEITEDEITEIKVTSSPVAPPEYPYLDYGRSVKFQIDDRKGCPTFDSSTYTSIINGKGSSYHFSDFQHPGSYDDDSDEEEEALFLQRQRSKGRDGSNDPPKKALAAKRLDNEYFKFDDSDDEGDLQDFESIRSIARNGLKNIEIVVRNERLSSRLRTEAEEQQPCIEGPQWAADLLFYRKKLDKLEGELACHQRLLRRIHSDQKRRRAFLPYSERDKPDPREAEVRDRIEVLEDVELPQALRFIDVLNERVRREVEASRGGDSVSNHSFLVIESAAAESEPWDALDDSLLAISGKARGMTSLASSPKIQSEAQSPSFIVLDQDEDSLSLRLGSQKPKTLLSQDLSAVAAEVAEASSENRAHELLDTFNPHQGLAGPNTTTKLQKAAAHSEASFIVIDEAGASSDRECNIIGKPSAIVNNYM